MIEVRYFTKYKFALITDDVVVLSNAVLSDLGILSSSSSSPSSITSLIDSVISSFSFPYSVPSPAGSGKHSKFVIL